MGDTRDTVRVEWRNVDTGQNYIINFYQNELKKSKYKIDVESQGQGVKQFSFSREDGISGSLYTEDSDTKQTGTEKVILTVNLK